VYRPPKKVLIVCCVCAILILCYCTYSYLTYRDLILPIPTTCTIGVSGSAANVTLAGIAANHACDEASSQSTMLYHMSETPQGNELCEGDIQNKGVSLHYIVRDSGLLNLVGGYICSKLREGAIDFLALRPTPTPTVESSPTASGISNTTTVNDRASILDATRSNESAP
jgi:hypothetical protein